jgi:DNA polymerase-1
VARVSKALFVDGHSLAYRAFFALPDTLATAEGQPTNAVLGFAQMLLRILEEEKPDYLAVAFDKGKPAFRLEEFAEYKAHRKPTPEKLRPQFALIKELVVALGGTAVEVDGWEGDDILAALTDLARSREIETLILTGDRDTLQLAGPGVNCIITLRGISETSKFDADAVREKYGVDPSQLPDLKGLVGDPSDNLPGVPGIGPKTALALLGKFGSLDSLLERLDEVTPERVRDALKTYAADARVCRSLATIRHAVPFEAELDVESFRYKGLDRDRLAGFLRRMEFRALLKRLGLAEKAAAAGTLFAEAREEREDDAPGLRSGRPTMTARPARARDVVRGRRLVSSLVDLAAAAETLAGAARLALAVTFDGERPLQAQVMGLAIAAEDIPETIYIPLAAAAPSAPTTLLGPPGLSFDELRGGLGALLSSPTPCKIMHGAKPFRVWLGGGNLTLGGVALDTELGAYLLDASRLKYTLESLCRELTGQDILLPDQEPENWRPSVPGLTWAGEKLCLMADMTLAVADPMRAELADKDLCVLLDKMEMPLQEVLVNMELAGVGIDAGTLGEMSAELGGRIAELANDIYAVAGRQFNLNSPRQLGEVLFTDLKLRPGSKTGAGAFSTNAEVLEDLAVTHPVAAKILLHRQLTKLKGTYTDGMAALINPETRRLHTVFKQTVTTTGRLSSAEPNLQNIPVREEEGRRIRRVFIAAPGHVLLAGDYSQIELRLMAHLSRDEAFVQAFLRGEDIHQRTASEIFGVPMNEVTPELRNKAKAVNFGIIYGVSDFGLARNTGVPREEAAAFIGGYFQRYPGIRTFVDRTLTEGRSRGFVTTLYGRRRYLPELHTQNRTLRGMAERAARNTPLQGTAADIIKVAMVRIGEEIRARGLGSRMILQVHDELLFEVPESEVAEMSALVKTRMEGVIGLEVPLEVDLKIGPNWYAMKKVT